MLGCNRSPPLMASGWGDSCAMPSWRGELLLCVRKGITLAFSLTKTTEVPTFPQVLTAPGDGGEGAGRAPPPPAQTLAGGRGRGSGLCFPSEDKGYFSKGPHGLESPGSFPSQLSPLSLASASPLPFGSLSYCPSGQTSFHMLHLFTRLALAPVFPR